AGRAASRPSRPRRAPRRRPERVPPPISPVVFVWSAVGTGATSNYYDPRGAGEAAPPLLRRIHAPHADARPSSLHARVVRAGAGPRRRVLGIVRTAGALAAGARALGDALR